MIHDVHPAKSGPWVLIHHTWGLTYPTGTRVPFGKSSPSKVPAGMEYVNSLEASGKYKHHQTISQNYPPEVQHTPFFRGELLNFRGVVPKIHVWNRNLPKLWTSGSKHSALKAAAHIVGGAWFSFYASRWCSVDAELSAIFGSRYFNKFHLIFGFFE